MAEDWSAIAADVAAGISDVGFDITLVRPGAVTGPATMREVAADTQFTVTCIDDNIKKRDADGTKVGFTTRVLTVAATGVIPSKDDRVIVRGVEHGIAEVVPIAPGGVDLLYEIELEA